MLNGRGGGGINQDCLVSQSPLLYPFFLGLFLASPTAAVSLYLDQGCVTAR